MGADGSRGASSRSIRWRLSAMMALLYAVQGAWWPLLAVHLRDLGVSGRGQGWIFAALAVASLASPLGMGHLADRRLPTQRLLAGMYGLGAIGLAVLATGAVRGAAPLFAASLAYWLVMAPAYGLGASLAFRNLLHPAEEFGAVRLWGTVGWMVAGWGVAGLMAATSAPGGPLAFVVAAGLSAATAAYCLRLPHTPPLAAGSRPGAGLAEGLELVRRRDVAIYLLSAFAVCLTTPYMYQVIPPYLRDRGLPAAWIPLAMTLGQVPEIVALAVLPRLVGRVGYRGVLALGIAAWAVRFGSLAADPPLWVALAGIALHGVAVAGFHIGGQLFLDDQAPPHRRAGVQGLYLVVTSGVGALAGNVLAGELLGRLAGRYGAIFLVPALVNAATLAFFLAAFRPGPGRDLTRGRPPGPRRGMRRGESIRG